MNFDPETYAAGISELNRKEGKRIVRRLEAALEEAERLARAISAADTKVRRVLLFGSVASGKPSREDFDIDLALDGGDVHTAMDIAEGSAFAVDVVELGHLSSEMRRLVLARGKVLTRQ
jgi:predicted nucleotidyltransferase